MNTKQVADVIDIPGATMAVEKQGPETLALARAEIDLQIATAKNYPRSLAQFQKSGLEMVTYSQAVAETLFYKLPRAGKIIEGPSVRFAEIVAQNWRNARVSAEVVGTDDKHVISRGFFHDLETNVAIGFGIRRRITRKDGSRYDDDMIGVTGAAAAGIAFRNAVLKGIPKMFWYPLYEQALVTARPDNKEIAERRIKALAEFAKLKVPEAAICKTLGLSGISKIGADELVTLRGIYNAIREGTMTAEEAFSDGPLQPTEEVPAEKPKTAKGKKEQPPPNPSVPKAQIPKEDDPLIDSKGQTEIYSKASANNWKIPDEVRTMLKKKFDIDSIKLVRRSMLPKILEILESGT